MDETRIVCAVEGSAIQVTADVLVGASHLTIAHEGPVAAQVVQASIGILELRNCRLTGGVRDDAQQRGGSGVFLQGTASATITSCLMEGNQGHGIFIGQEACVTVEGSSCSDSGLHGIAFHASAGGTVTNTKAKDNGKHGVRLGEQVSTKLRENT